MAGMHQCTSDISCHITMHDIEDIQMICEISSKHRGFIVIFFTIFNGQSDILSILLTKEYSLQVGEGFFPQLILIIFHSMNVYLKKN